MTMRKTKIICTLGPSTDDPAVLRELMLSGMDVARINMSHQDHDAHRARIDRVRALREELRLPIAILIDTKGPEIRLGTFPEKVTLKAGDTFTLTTVPAEGTAEQASISFAGLPGDVDKGSHILIDDGLIDLIVEKTTDTDIVCTVLNGGTVSSNKGINVPVPPSPCPFMSERARPTSPLPARWRRISSPLPSPGGRVMCFRSARSSNSIKTTPSASSRKSKTPRVSTTSTTSSRFRTVSWSPGAIWGWKFPLEEIPSIQKTLIHKGYNAGLQVITATQMLDSMMKNPRPTRAGGH